MRDTALLVSAMLLALACESESTSERASTAEGEALAAPVEPAPTGASSTPLTAVPGETVPTAAALKTAAFKTGAAPEAAAKGKVVKSQPPSRDVPDQASADHAGQSSKPDAAEAKPEAPAPKAVAWKSGGRTEDPAFSVWLEGPVEVVVGEPSRARARVVAKEPYKCNDKYPAKFHWDPQEGLSVGSAKVRGMSVTGKKGSLALPFSTTRPGPVTLSGTLSFSVCTKENCRVEKRKLRLSTKAIPQG